MIADTVVTRNVAQLSNGAKPTIDTTLPYVATVTIRGVAPLLMHAWNTESVAEKAGAAKNSKAKKTDDVASYAYRTADGLLGVPGRNFHGSLCIAGKFKQDPRSSRKSMYDLCKAGLVPLDVVAPFQPATTEWDYEDRQRATVQRAAITRTRPAMREGWVLAFDVLVTLPEYFSVETVADLVNSAGRVVGLCDYRPTYGRFTVIGFDVIQEHI